MAASPFNEIKLELAIAGLLGGLLWLAEDLLLHEPGAQIVLLLGYAVTAAAWLMVRTRRVLRARLDYEHEPQQE